MDKCWGFFGDVIHGAKGCAVLGEGITEPQPLQGPPADAREPDLEVQGRRRATTTRSSTTCCSTPSATTSPTTRPSARAKAAMIGILGRMAAESGKMVTWDEALASNLELAPGLDKLTMDSPAPVMPDAQGHYPVAMPGFTTTV